MYDLLIKGGKLIDGSGNPAIITDIGILGDKITQIGLIDSTDSKQTIDATGRYVCPGFIDTPMTERIRFKPFLKDVNTAAKSFIKAIEKGKKTYIYPWQMYLLTKIVKVIPQSIIDLFIGDSNKYYK